MRSRRACRGRCSAWPGRPPGGGWPPGGALGAAPVLGDDLQLALELRGELVGVGQLVLGEQTGLDALGEFDLLLGVEQRDLADLLEVVLDRVGGGTGRGDLLGRRARPRPRRTARSRRSRCPRARRRNLGALQHLFLEELGVVLLARGLLGHRLLRGGGLLGGRLLGGRSSRGRLPGRRLVLGGGVGEASAAARSSSELAQLPPLVIALRSERPPFDDVRVEEVPVTDGTHARADVRPGADQALGLQHAQRLADDGTGHLEPLADPSGPAMAVGAQVAGNDHLAERWTSCP
ncbi:hypothetical protein SFUMM280S_03723 [Streptomyces fumanus]